MGAKRLTSMVPFIDQIWFVVCRLNSCLISFGFLVQYFLVLIFQYTMVLHLIILCILVPLMFSDVPLCPLILELTINSFHVVMWQIRKNVKKSAPFLRQFKKCPKLLFFFIILRKENQNMTAWCPFSITPVSAHISLSTNTVWKVVIYS